MPALATGNYKWMMNVPSSSHLIRLGGWVIDPHDSFFGMSSAPEIYQREMGTLLEGILVDIIANDFLIHGKEAAAPLDKMKSVISLPLYWVV